MNRIYLIVPTAAGVGSPDIAKALFEALKSKVSKIGYFDPFSQVKNLLVSKESNVLMEQVVEAFHDAAEGKDAMIVNGVTFEKSFRAQTLNEKIAGALDAGVILVTSAKGRSVEDLPAEAEIDAADFSELKNRVIGAIVNDAQDSAALTRAFAKSSMPVLAFTPKATELSGHLELAGLDKLCDAQNEHRVTQAEFRSGLLRMARRKLQRIVLPEGAEPRTVKAAVMAFERKIAVPVLLAKRSDVEAVAAREGVKIPAGLEIVEPTAELQSKYVALLVELRQAKGMTEDLAKDALKDTVMLGTMMLKKGEVDGLVSGAVHSTADTVRPALQIIKTAPGVKKISAAFFMCLPSQVFVYGDCAINQNPEAEDLAGIAIQCNDTATAFGLPSRVAMLSYSTGKSGKGDDVDLVIAATAAAKAARPDMVIDGPLQYDAATVPSVASLKAPGSPVAGRATVFVFPDLNCGNITYKAVQRSAPNVISIGPMLQGLAKPVNDLSRGALVEDIIYTIALTAIQAQSIKA